MDALSLTNFSINLTISMKLAEASLDILPVWEIHVCI